MIGTGHDILYKVRATVARLAGLLRPDGFVLWSRAAPDDRPAHGR
ncbi:hypothetical protein SAMN05444678_12316 [Sphingomonas sp. YR710]|nr:hypothetical protein SAMN05444678_12316 [Sphingomonas sp. YR710]